MTNFHYRLTQESLSKLTMMNLRLNGQISSLQNG